MHTQCTPHDRRMITWLTSESLQTQARGHFVTNHFHGSSLDRTGHRMTIQRVRCPLLPPNQSTYHRHTTELMLIIWCELVRTVSITVDAAIQIDLCESAEFVHVTHTMEFFLCPVPRYLSHGILGTRTARVN